MLDANVVFTLFFVLRQEHLERMNGTMKRLKIAPGTQNNTKIRMKGFGVPVLKESRNGDQFVKVNVEVPKKLTDKQARLIEQLAADGM